MQRGSFGRLVAAFASGFLLAKKVKGPAKGDDASGACSNNKKDQARVVERHIVSLPSVEVRTHPEERKYQQHRDRYSWVQPALLVAAVVAAVLSAYAASEASRQATAAEEANRPWISFVEAMPISPLSFTEDGEAKLSIAFKVNNPGHSPALHTTLNLKLFVRDVRAFEMRTAKTTCVKPRLQLDDIFSEGLVIFPNEMAPFIYSATMSKDDVLRFKSDPSTAIMLAGCVSYSVSESKGSDRHYTYYAAEVDKNGPTPFTFFPIPRDGTPVPANEIALAVNPRLIGIAN